MKILILEGLYGNNKGKKMQWRLKRTNLKVGDKVVLDCKDWKIIKVIGEKKRSLFPKGVVFNEYSVKEVKKVKYLEVKVVKVKKGTSYMCIDKKLCRGCIIYQRCLKQREISKQPKGNWVNGENLDKIKFPCFCSYVYNDKRMYGMIVTDYVGTKDVYSLIHINDQSRSVSCEFTNETLGELIKVHDIHILKAKIIIYEEE